MTTEIVKVDQGNLIGIPDPQGMLDVAITAAKALANVVSQKKDPVMMNGEQYLEFSDWQTLGQFYGVTVSTGDAEPVSIDGVKGAKAKATLLNLGTGERIGGAEAYCLRDEPKWNTRPKYEYQDNKRVKIGDEPVPWFQLASMAQTRAGAKAFRNRLAWIAVLAGYKTTPAEELEDMRQQNLAEHYCHEHNAPFFKKGKMKSYAHPIGDTGDWCYERSPFAAKTEVAKAKAEVEPEKAKKPKSKAEPATEEILQDMKGSKEKAPELLQETPSEIPWASVRPGLTKLYNEKVGDWTTNGILTKLADLGADTSSGKIQPSFESLTPENKKKFAEMVAQVAG